jgi:predicted nucleic acid-binding protein
MKWYVVDASVTVKWFVGGASDEDHVPQALQLLTELRDGRIALLQPAHWKAEVAAVLARLLPGTAQESVQDLLLIEGIEVCDLPQVYSGAVKLARYLDHHLFDTLYHATAIHADASLVTADRRYYDKAAQLGNILLLEQLPGI